MRYNRLSLARIILLLTVLFVIPYTSFAQTGNVCTALVREALRQTAVNCTNNDSNSVCYGFPEIDSVLADTTLENAFSEPGDAVSTADIVTLRPQAINVEDETWGITVMNLQASLPSGLEDDVVVIGLGGAEIESGVLPEDAFVPTAEPLSLTTAAAGEFRAATLTAPQRAEVIGQVPGGTTVSADAVSQNGDWVRVIHDEEPGWLSIDAFGDADLTGLPTLNDGQLSALQSLYMRTGIDSGSCAPTSSWVLVQGPKDTPVDIIVNGLTVRIESTIALRTLQGGEPVGRQLQIIVLYGLAKINPDTTDELIVPPGYVLNAGFGPDLVSLGIEGDEDERSGPITLGAPGLVTQQQLDDLSIVSLLPVELLNYLVSLPILVTPSGVGSPVIQLVFGDPDATAKIKALCEEGVIPVEICQVYGL